MLYEGIKLVHCEPGREEGSMIMMTISHYTGGNSGWGTMVCECADCREVVAEYETDELGRPTTAIFDNTNVHECLYNEDEEEVI